MSKWVNHNPTMPKVAKVLMEIKDRPDIALAVENYRQAAVRMSEIRFVLSSPDVTKASVIDLIKKYEEAAWKRRELLTRLEEIAVIEKVGKWRAAS